MSIAALVAAPTARAQSDDDQPQHGHRKADSLDDSAKFAWLDAELKKINGPTERWNTGWTATFGWLALGQWAFVGPSPNAGLREMSVVGATNATLGLIAMIAAPNTLGGDALAHVEQFDASTPLGAYERRRRAEYLLHATAAEEGFFHGPIPLILAGASSAAGGAILIYGYHQVAAGWAQFGAGVGLTLLQMLTRPSSATDAWERYKNKYHPAPNPQVPPDQIQMYFGFSPMGAAMTGTF
ncbi:MAG TPA: hypothetical protein VHV30_06225 [Polyangiaceae bacterium]|nr:hypothetical protein [Polyangiaceae bacterium]